MYTALKDTFVARKHERGLEERPLVIGGYWKNGAGLAGVKLIGNWEPDILNGKLPMLVDGSDDEVIHVHTLHVDAIRGGIYDIGNRMDREIVENVDPDRFVEIPGKSYWEDAGNVILARFTGDWDSKIYSGDILVCLRKFENGKVHIFLTEYMPIRDVPYGEIDLERVRKHLETNYFDEEYMVLKSEFARFSDLCFHPLAMLTYKIEKIDREIYKIGQNVLAEAVKGENKYLSAEEREVYINYNFYIRAKYFMDQGDKLLKEAWKTWKQMKKDNSKYALGLKK